MSNRIIKESIRTSRKINDLTDFQFRLWLYLITYVDDYGRGSADPEILKGFVFPRRKRVSEKDIQDALAELAGMGCINLYRVDGESYFCFPNWGNHQRVRTKISKFPAPDKNEMQDAANLNELKQSAASCGELRQIAADCGELRLESRIQNPESGIQNTESGIRDIGRAQGATSTRFRPPTVEEVREYCAERKNNVDAERFVDYYESNGWMVGKSRMKSWKAAVRTWERNGFSNSANNQKPPEKPKENELINCIL